MSNFFARVGWGVTILCVVGAIFSEPRVLIGLGLLAALYLGLLWLMESATGVNRRPPE